MNKLRERYKKEVIPAMVEKFGYKSIMQIPKIEKVAINMGIEEAKDSPKVPESAISDLQIIAGQGPVLTRIKRSVANSKIRENMALGCEVILRKTNMCKFIDKLISIALPRIGDFRGVSAKTLDRRGNYPLGIKKQLIFPEIEHDKVDKVRGMNIIFATSANTDEEARELLRFLGMSFAQ